MTGGDHLPYAEVAVALPLWNLFTYQIPPRLLGSLEVGHGVLVPFGQRQVTGFVVGLLSSTDLPSSRIKDITDLLTVEPLFGVELLPFYRWLAGYYQHPPGEVLRAALPSGVFLKSRPTLSLTPAGEVGHTEGPEAQVITWLKEEGPTPLSKIIRRLEGVDPGVGAARVVRRLVDKGWADTSQQVGKARAAVRFETWFGLRSEAETPELRLEETARAMGRIGEVQREVITSLAHHQQITAAELRREISSLGHDAGRVNLILRQLEQKGLVQSEQREVLTRGPEGLHFNPLDVVLGEGQQQAVALMGEAVRRGEFASFLLQGVTGSGKTEVYLRLAKVSLDLGRPVLILVPEIALTPQLLGRFATWFGDKICCLHSELSDQERFDAWRRIRRGEIQVVVGARSAIFAPFVRPGLIVVDEEHDPSFKQDDGLRYSGRDVALVRGREAGAVVVLGSATPSLESRLNADRGRFGLVRLAGRVGGRPMPEVELVDMRQPENFPRNDDELGLSPRLRDSLLETFDRGQQAILLLNRRGFAPFVLCPRCGYGFKCGACDVSMTYHQRRGLLLCHHCGAAQRLPENCPQCGFHSLERVGIGTERLAGDLTRTLPGVAVGRLDRDIARNRNVTREVLDQFRRGEIQLLVGTQMLAKGHDFPGVTLVGILQADYLLNLPDFRASERTFQLVTQVAGRAGRGDIPGRVLVQSMSPEHYSLAFAARHDFEGFYRHESRLRQLHRYPPYSRLIMLHLNSSTENQGNEVSRKLVAALRLLPREGIEILGPAPSPMPRLQNVWRFQILLKAAGPGPLQQFLPHLIHLDGVKNPPAGVEISWDVDPLDLL